MIELNVLATAIENGLNANGDINFKIFSDKGTFDAGLKTRYDKIKYTNGLLTMVDSAVVPVQGLIVATFSTRLEIVVQLPSQESDEEIITTHRSAMDNYFKSATKLILGDTDGKVYTVSAVYSLANTGIIELRDNVGMSITFVVSINYSLVQNGLNSYDCVIELNGERLPYTTATVTRVPVMEPSVGSQSNSITKNYTESTALGIDLEIPATEVLPNGFSRLVFDYILSGTSPVLDLVVGVGTALSSSYKVLFGSVNLALDGINNGGHKVSFVEALEV